VQDRKIRVNMKIRVNIRPRIVVTGFSAFPGAPVNPTEGLMAALAASRSDIIGACDLGLAVLPVEHRRIDGALAQLGASCACPDIALHFGLSRKARGFTLERQAVNFVEARADQAGHVCKAAAISPAHPHVMAASLPLQPLFDTLSARGLPVSWSHDAGRYLCNYTLFASLAGLVEGWRPKQAAFIHVPSSPDDVQAHDPTMEREMLLQGAIAIIEHAVQSASSAVAAPV